MVRRGKTRGQLPTEMRGIPRTRLPIRRWALAPRRPRAKGALIRRLLVEKEPKLPLFRLKAMGSYKNWVGTLNNPTEAEEALIRAADLQFLVYQHEVGEENGVPHLQAYFVLKARKALCGVKTLVGGRWHLEPRRGSHADAVKYNSKERTRAPGTEPFVSGVPPAQGTRSDLVHCKEILDAGGSMKSVSQEEFGTYVRCRKGLEGYQSLNAPAQNTAPEVHVLWGGTGTGKTRAAAEEAGPDAYWVGDLSSSGTLFFDGYEGQENVVWDEFYGKVPLSLFLRLLDRYPIRVNTKGGNTQWSPKKIWITSNACPTSWYPDSDFAPLQRRITEDRFFQ